MTAPTGQFEYTSSVANLHFFRERGGGLWCEVLDYGSFRPNGRDANGKLRFKRARHEWSVRVYGNGRGEIAAARHTFARPPGHPPDRGRVVTRLVRQALAE